MNLKIKINSKLFEYYQKNSNKEAISFSIIDKNSYNRACQFSVGSKTKIYSYLYVMKNASGHYDESSQFPAESLPLQLIAPRSRGPLIRREAP